MSEFRPGTPAQDAFLRELVAAGLLIESGVPGVYGRGATFEAVREGFDALVTRAAADEGAESLRFPPVLPRRQLERSGYLSSFPHLAGAVFAFEGTEAQAATQHERALAGEDWTEHQAMTDLVLMPAVCYPVYPAIARRGAPPEGGATIDPGGPHALRP